MDNNHDVMALKILELAKEDGNNVCADCREINPKWTSWNLGIFICMNCAGLHRKLGVGISKVKSITLDNWNERYLESMRTVGNARSNAYYEANLPSSFHRPSYCSNTVQMETFIVNKYVKKLYISTKADDYPFSNKSASKVCTASNNKQSNNLKKLSPGNTPHQNDDKNNHKNDLFNLFCDYTPCDIEKTNRKNETNLLEKREHISATVPHIMHSLSNDQILKLFDNQQSSPHYNQLNSSPSTNSYSNTKSTHTFMNDPFYNQTNSSLPNSAGSNKSNDPYENIFK